MPPKSCNCTSEIDALQAQIDALSTAVSSVQSVNAQQWTKLNCLEGLHPSGSCA